jgi:hypothetical protein
MGLNWDVESIEIMEGGDEPWRLILMLVVYTYFFFPPKEGMLRIFNTR